MSTLSPPPAADTTEKKFAFWVRAERLYVLLFNEEMQAIKDAITDLSADDVFTDMERLQFKASIANARTLPLLQEVLNATQAAYETKKGATE